MVQRFHLTYSSVAVLQSVARGYSYGFDIMDATGLPSGTVYPALRRLKQLGFVGSRWESQVRADEAKRPRRRYYQVTKRGDVALADALKRFHILNEPLAEAEGEPASETS